MKPKTALYVFVIIALLAVIGTGGEARAAAQDAPRIEIYGFVQLDAIYDFDRVDPSWDATLRPSKISVGATNQFGHDGETIFSVKQTRFGVNGYIPTELGELKTKFEFDLFGVGADAGQTTIRLRHAYGELGQFLAGQTNSLFMDIDVYPNVVDYWGPAGMIFFRNIQARWTFMKQGGTKAAVALESPGSAIDTGKLNLVDINGVSSWNKYPDLTGQYRMDGTWGHFQAAGIMRWLGYSSPDGGISGHKTGWGANLSGAVHTVGKDSILAQLAYGEGIANYFNDGGVDLAPQSSAGGAEALPILGLLLYYDKYWSDKWSSSIGYSETEQHNSGGQEPTAFHRGQYASVNLLHYPAKNVMVGGEFLWGKLEQNGGETGHDSRIQFSAKYNF
ncbi:MAG TPA: DcaP family trimeric outer membrane transporter [Nitrospirota bacterium]|nr:DcaP family trimeric outer membrane transporter [Nitrospirota bacterium]